MQIRPISRKGDRRGYDCPRKNPQRHRGKSFREYQDNVEIPDSEIEKVVIKPDGTHDLSNTTIGLGLKK